MKRLFVSLLGLLLTAGLVSAQNSYVISSDRSPNVDLDNYKTYGWTSSVVNETDASYSLNDLILKNRIKKVIEAELAGLGYKSSTNPDILLSFIVFDKETEFRGYGPVQAPNSYYNYWTNFNNKVLGEPTTYNFQEGTILVHILDTEKSEVVWQGYASGIMDNNVFDTNPDNIHEAVQLIFDNFKERADNYENTGR